MKKVRQFVTVAVAVVVSLSCVTPIAHADTFSNDDVAALRKEASHVMDNVYRASDRAGISRDVFTNDDLPSAPVGGTTNVPTAPHTFAHGMKDDSYNSSGVYRGYMGNVDSPALMNDSEAGRYFRRKNTGASIPARSCQASLTNLLPDKQLIPNPSIGYTQTGVDAIFNGPGLDALLTAVKQAQEPYMSSWAKEAVEARRVPGPHNPYGEEKSRASQRYNRELMLRGHGRTPEEQQRLRYMVESAEKEYWIDQLSTHQAQNSLWIPLTIAILSGDRAKVKQVLSFMPQALRHSVEISLDAIDVGELTFLIETGIILMQDILILMKFIVIFTIVLVALIVGGSVATVVSGGTAPLAVLSNPHTANEIRQKLMDPAVNGIAQALKTAQNAIVDILRITGRMLEHAQKYYDIWNDSPFLPSAGDLANALNPYTQLGHDFYCLMPTSLNQSRTIVTSGYAISGFMTQLATIDTRPLAIQIQKTADSLDNMKRYSNKVINKSVSIYRDVNGMLSGDGSGLSSSTGSIPGIDGGSLFSNDGTVSLPNVSSGHGSTHDRTGRVTGPVSTSIPGVNGGTTFSNEGDPSQSLGSSKERSSLIGPTFANVSALKTIKGLNIGPESTQKTVSLPIGQTVGQTPSLDSVIPRLFPDDGTRTPALYDRPSSGWAPIQNSAIVDVASSGLLSEKVIRKLIDSAKILSADVPRLTQLLLSTPEKVIRAGHEGDDNGGNNKNNTTSSHYSTNDSTTSQNTHDENDDTIDLQTVALFITDLSRTLYDTLDLFMITRAFIMPFITSFLHMSFMMIVLSAPGKNDIPVVGHAVNLLEPGVTATLNPLAQAINSPEFVHLVARSPLVTVGPTVTRILVNMAVRAQVVGSIMEAIAFPEDTSRRFTDSYLGTPGDQQDIYESGVPVVDAQQEDTNTSQSRNSKTVTGDTDLSSPSQNGQSFTNQ